MICIDSLHQACQDLFARYPQAVMVATGHGQAANSMVLMVRTGSEAEFYVLSHPPAADSPFALCRWPHGDAVDIRADTDAATPDLARSVVSRAIPFPADGSLFGWTHEHAITALIVFYGEYSPESPQPSWAVMPLEGTPDQHWPPFTEERIFGSWFWEHHQAGRIVSLATLVGSAQQTIFWTDTKEILGSDCCAVAHDLRTPDGPTLPRGRYVYYQALRAGKSAPPLSVLLAGTGKVDLAPRFQQCSAGR